MTHLQKFRETLGEYAALISSPQNCFYLSGFPFEDGCLLITAGNAYMLTDSRYCEAAAQTADADFEILTPKKQSETVRELLAKEGKTCLLFEERAMTVAEKDAFAKALPDIELRGAASLLLSRLRAEKDGKELSLMAKAQEITDAAFTHILGYLRPGVKERDVALELEFFMRKQGADGVAFDTIAVSGGASSLPHGVPRDRVLEKGFLTMDFGARFCGYCSDMTRTVVIGKADAEMKKLYATVLEAQRAALDAVCAGASCKAVDAVARNIIEGAGYVGKFGHSLGHGVGLDIHEAPRLSPAAPDTSFLRPGNVVTVEPGIYLPGQYGCRIEDMVAVEKNGVLNFTKSGKELIEL